MSDTNGMSLYSMLAEAALKGAIVLAVAWLITLMLRRRSAASRHLVWSAAFASLLILPPLSVVVPKISVPINTSLIPLTIDFKTDASSTTAASPASNAPHQPAPAGYTPPPEQTDWRLWIAGLWLAGSALAFAQLLLSWLALRRMSVRRASYPEIAELSAELGIQREVEVYESSSCQMPMTFGLTRSIVLLPAEAAVWTADRRRVVLLHELAHIRRGDSAAHVLGRLVVNLYWWNPLAWLAWRCSVRERELAADDLVLASGATASEYANHLLEIARAMQTPARAGTLAVAMARRSQLEGRLVAILDSAINRNAPGRLAFALTAMLAVSVLLPLAAVNAQETQPVETVRKQLDDLRTRYADQIDEIKRLETKLALTELAAHTEADKRQRERLRNLQNLTEKLEEMRKTYMDTHPDVTKLKAELAAHASIEKAQLEGLRDSEKLARKLEELRKQYTENHPDVIRLKAELAQVQFRTAPFEKERERSPNEPVTPFDRERRLIEADLTRITASSPQSKEHGLTLLKLGDWHRRHGKPADAREPYIKAHLILGDSAEAVPALIGLGVEALIEKDLNNAAGYFQKAQTIDPTKAGVALMWMGVIRHQQNSAAEAESLFRGALAVQDPSSIDAAVTMDLYALFLSNENRSGEAESMKNRAAAIRKERIAQKMTASSGDVHRIGGGVSPPSLAFKVEPAYSEEARVARFQGTSVLHVEIGPDGIARNVRVVRWLGLGLDERAIEAISQWRFKPGIKDGAPVTVAATIEVNFRLL